MNPVYTIVIGLVITLFRVLRWDVRVRGHEHVPATGPGVVATNHIGYLDFVFAGYGVRHQGRRRLRFVAKREVFDHPVSGPLMRAMGHIAVDRGGNTRVALREVADALAAGHLVGMFPEGTISRSFVPLAGRPGAARMAMDAGAPLIPGAVWGTHRVYTKGRKPRLFRGLVVTVAFGPPIAYTPDEDATAVHERLMAAVAAMVDELQRTYPQAPSGPDDTWWQPAHLGGSAPTAEQAEAAARADRERLRRERRGS
ncbi:lysophospholipid acyltransferase family protein [Egicoccus halophilus]|uniref:1-acyl-sn-glycerol-3-phosphate acyltransferase n=1 Tax=Egicoccus halophilus TaxID=1670830 RepID=A0A8J3AB00_9ACTN|nr:lysophospholipid acyltransferase family protein [Egicoccus halophilus]GGI09662.1 1-acyl-sn-glycerol-3-phosphate acyltransferase [Egicoccus halophilus]